MRKRSVQIEPKIAQLRFKVVERVTMLLLHRWQRFFFALLVFIPSQAKAEPDQAGQTDVELTGEKLAQLVHDRENGDDSCAHSVMGLISFYTCLPCAAREELSLLKKTTAL
jgi:hypothetical protein